jgi:RimJ/RimL family protein N-acetyltransferase
LNKVIGIAGLDYPNDWPEPEIQWGLSRKFWGQGYASEAARAVKEMAANHLPDLSLISLIHPENQNSINLAKVLGAQFEREYYFRDDNWHIYRHV